MYAWPLASCIHRLSSRNTRILGHHLLHSQPLIWTQTCADVIWQLIRTWMHGEVCGLAPSGPLGGHVGEMYVLAPSCPLGVIVLQTSYWETSIRLQHCCEIGI